MRFFHISSFVTFLFIFQCGTAFAAPVPHWINANGPADQEASLRQTLFIRPGVVKAILFGAADAKTTVHLNGSVIGTFESIDKPTAIDITKELVPGNNVIGLRTTGTAAVLLELTRDGGQSQVLVTDRNWLASPDAPRNWDTAAFDAVAWRPARSMGEVGTLDSAIRGNPFDPTKVIDAYNSWRLAVRGGQATDPKSITALPGFTVELVRSAQFDEDSWIALAFDPKGRITIAKERKGLIRMTLTGGANGQPVSVSKVEKLDDSLMECRGLLYAHDVLYVNANNSRALYRLRDTTPNDTIDYFDEQKILLRTEGSVGHGRNQLTLGPDDAVYITHGDDVRLPEKLAESSPFKNAAVDRLIPSPWDAQLDSSGEQLPGGHVLRMDKEGRSFELIAAGFRNPMAVAFNEAGEMFTYDADMELDLGTPWYRPTRINHVVSGGEYGWRRGTGKWPACYPDSMGSVCDIGLGSPTGVKFGTHSKFPQRYREALFIGDWAYGRIMAVHLTAKGSTYVGGFETFLSGRPLNVTDLAFGPDGALYFITGGRQTQSGLYRVRYTGDASATAKEPGDAEQQAAFAAEKARFHRAELEQLHRPLPAKEAADAVKLAMKQLDSNDPAMRFAARIVLEHQTPALWVNEVFNDHRPTAQLTGLLAVARTGDPALQPKVIASLAALALETLTLEQQLLVTRVYTLAFTRMGRPSGESVANILPRLEAMYPSPHAVMNRDLAELLAYLGSNALRDKTFLLLDRTQAPDEMLHYLCMVKHQRQGWTRETLTLYLRALNRAAHLHPGRYYTTCLRALRVEIAGAMTNEMKLDLAQLLAEPSPPASHLAADKAVFVREWKLEDLLPELDKASKGRSFEKGREAFEISQCGRCHRMDTHVPGAELGPDLTAVASRFNRRDLLESIMNPSKAIDDKFKLTQITLKDDRIISGYIGQENGKTLILHANQLSLDGESINKLDIVSRKLSDISPMPAGLLSVLTQEQILDLLAYLESGGKADHAAYLAP